MGPSQSQLKLLSPEDRRTYRKWLRAGLLFYGSLLGLLAFAIFVHLVVTPLSPDVASTDADEMHTAAISARK